MKNYTIFVCLTLLIGCKQVNHNTSSINPFSSFALTEVHKIAICFDDVAYNIATPTEEDIDSMETDEYGIWEGSTRVYYLNPSGYSINNRGTIKKLYDAGVKIKHDKTYPWFDKLCYLVFLNEKNKILATTSVLNIGGYVIFEKVENKNGFLKFSDNDKDIRYAGQSKKYTSLIYDLMEKKFPNDIKRYNAIYLRKYGKTLKEMFKTSPTALKKQLNSSATNDTTDKKEGAE